jgi:hypothetical protein
MSLVPFDDPVDHAMGYYCKFNTSDMKCIAPFPALVGVSKPAGGIERWRDMDHTEDGAGRRTLLMTFRVFSAGEVLRTPESRSISRWSAGIQRC